VVEYSRLYSKEVTKTVRVISEPSYILHFELDSSPVRQGSKRAVDGAGIFIILGVRNLLVYIYTHHNPKLKILWFCFVHVSGMATTTDFKFVVHIAIHKSMASAVQVVTYRQIAQRPNNWITKPWQ